MSRKALEDDRKCCKNELFYKAYEVNYTFYKKLWDGFTSREKSVLFDIAEDFVLNLHNKEVICVLIHKNIIHDEAGFLQLFNSSFTFFVRKQQNDVEEINAQLRANNSGGWKQLSLPLKLIAASVIVFLFVMNQEFLTNIQSIILSAGAILSFTMRFLKTPGGDNSIT